MTKRVTVILSCLVLLMALFSTTAFAGGTRINFAEGCDAERGPDEEAPIVNKTTYTTNQTVNNVVFDDSHSDDLVRVYGAHVIFDHVTFRGLGTGSTGHSLEVKQGGSVEVYDSTFDGDPVEDVIQFGGPNGDQHSDTSTVKCNTFEAHPGEDFLDFKDGNDAIVDIIDNNFTTSTTGGRTVQNAGTNGVQNFIGNTGMENVLFEDGVADGSFVNNVVDELYLYDTEDILVQGNELGKVGNGNSAATLLPTDIYYLSNNFPDNQWEYYGGTCYEDNNTGANLTSDCTAGPPAWYP